ncbi:hypothetical protein M758_4G022300 [Ceratodon purpureus]|nr:hypothetical protein M758_4G022300 [Ceratodon purpureus]
MKPSLRLSKSSVSVCIVFFSQLTRRLNIYSLFQLSTRAIVYRVACWRSNWSCSLVLRHYPYRSFRVFRRFVSVEVTVFFFFCSRFAVTLLIFILGASYHGTVFRKCSFTECCSDGLGHSCQ